MATMLHFPKALSNLAAATTLGPTLAIGSQGNLVVELQNQLKLWGFDPRVVDGAYGQNTANAVAALQKKLGIDADGKFGDQTRKAVVADLASTASVIRANQKAMGLDISVAQSTSDSAPAAESTFMKVLKSPYTWLGVAALAGGAWWYLGRRSAAERRALPAPREVAPVPTMGELGRGRWTGEQPYPGEEPEAGTLFRAEVESDGGEESPWERQSNPLWSHRRRRKASRKERSPKDRVGKPRSKRQATHE